MHRSSGHKDAIRFHWMGLRHPTIEYVPDLPDGSRTDRPWRIAAQGSNPCRGKTVREAIDNIMRFEDRAIRKMLSKIEKERVQA